MFAPAFDSRRKCVEYIQNINRSGLNDFRFAESWYDIENLILEPERLKEQISGLLKSKELSLIHI